MFAVSQSSYFPLFCSRKIFEWNFIIVFLSCSGAFWAVCVFLRRATPYLRQKAKNQWSDVLKSAFSGLRSFTNCIIWVLNHHLGRLYPPFTWSWIHHVSPFLKKGKKTGDHDAWFATGLLIADFLFASHSHVYQFFCQFAVKFTFFPLLKNQLATFNLNSRLSAFLADLCSEFVFFSLEAMLSYSCRQFETILQVMLISVSLVSLGFFNSQSNATALMVWRKVRALCKRSKLAHLMQSSKFKKTLLTTVVLKAWHRFALQASPPGLKFIMYMNTSTKLERSSHAFWSPVIPTVLVTMLLWWRQELKIPTRKKLL